MSVPNLKTYARLLLNTGVALGKGQKLYVIAEPAHREFVTLLLEEAYGLGAAYVHVELRDTTWQRARLEHSAAADLEFTPGWLEPYYRELVDNDWAYLYLSGSENPAAYDGLDPARISRWNLATQAKRTYFREAMTSSRVRWCVAALPTDGWARQVLGAHATAADLWKSVAPILLLDTTDPTAAWRAKIATLSARCRLLRDLRGWNRSPRRHSGTLALARRRRSGGQRQPVLAEPAHRRGVHHPRLAPHRGPLFVHASHGNFRRGSAWRDHELRKRPRDRV